MKVLAVDTCTASCSVAVASDTSLLAELTITRAETHSKHLLAMVREVLHWAEVKVKALDLLAVTRGPGSFTGLRIGISTVKALALALGKPVVGVSSLAALVAGRVGTSGLVVPLIDARRREVYCSRYLVKGTTMTELDTEKALPPLDAVAGIDQPCLLIGSGALLYQELLKGELGERAFFPAGQLHAIQASAVARLALERFAHGQIDKMRELVPRYLRLSDAEMMQQRPERAP